MVFFKAEDFQVPYDPESPTASQITTNSHAYKVAEIANQILFQRGQVVRCRSLKEHGTYLSDWKEYDLKDEDNDYEARLVCVERIEKDTVEKVLTDLVDHMEKWNSVFCGSPFFERAKKVLERT